jgi:hypothetical protein
VPNELPLDVDVETEQVSACTIMLTMDERLFLNNMYEIMMRLGALNAVFGNHVTKNADSSGAEIT